MVFIPNLWTAATPTLLKLKLNLWNNATRELCIVPSLFGIKDKCWSSVTTVATTQYHHLLVPPPSAPPYVYCTLDSHCFRVYIQQHLRARMCPKKDWSCYRCLRLLYADYAEVIKLSKMAPKKPTKKFAKRVTVAGRITFCLHLHLHMYLHWHFHLQVHLKYIITIQIHPAHKPYGWV